LILDQAYGEFLSGIFYKEDKFQEILYLAYTTPISNIQICHGAQRLRGKRRFAVAQRRQNVAKPEERSDEALTPCYMP